MQSVLSDLNEAIKAKELNLKKGKPKENEKINLIENLNSNPVGGFDDDEDEDDLSIKFINKSVEKIIDIKESKFFLY